MGTFDDIDLERTEVWNSGAALRTPNRLLTIGVVVVLLIAGAGGWWWLRSRTGSKAEIDRLAAGVPGPSNAKPTPPPAAIELPSLDALDPTMVRLIGELTTSPLLAEWLTTDHLARQVVALVDGAGGAQTPLKLLKPLRPAGAFLTAGRQSRPTISAASHARYDALASAIVAVDPAAAAKVYRTLSPRLEEAHDELGNEERSFDESLRTALRRLTETRVPEGPIAVEGRGGIYAFADPELEALSPSQKLLLRSGAANASRIQAWLRAFGAALDSPPATTP